VESSAPSASRASAKIEATTEPLPQGAVRPGGLEIPHPIHDATRQALLQAALARVDRAELTAALGGSVPLPRAALAARNAFNALRRHRDPATVLGRPQYRPALALVAAAVSEACLDACIGLLGENADDPTKEQLDEALDAIGTDFPPTTVAVMLAAVADSEMPASDLCLEILATDERFGLTEVADRPAGMTDGGETDGGEGGSGETDGGEGSPIEETSEIPSTAGDEALPGAAERREERRLRRRRDAEARRKRSDAARRSAEQVRRARRRGPDAPSHHARSTDATAVPPSSAPRLRRRAVLTPVQEREFDRDDPWSGAVVFAWIPFDGGDGTELDGKSRRCVVVAGSSGHLLVRPGYSEGGSKSRDWKAVELRGWRNAGFDQPTWIDFEPVRVERGAAVTPVGWLSAEDWNALW
jgi:hypothetical protein